MSTVTIRWRTEALTAWRWPAPRDPTRAPFSATHADTLKLLDRELRMLGAEEAVLGVVTSTANIRLDGLLRADAAVHHGGVTLTFTCNHGLLAYQCATYDRNGYLQAWQANLRALVLGLEALRSYERHVGASGKQYRGFMAIEAGPAAYTVHEHFDSVSAARAWVRDLTGSAESVSDHELLRRGKFASHPDTDRGSEELWTRYQAARVMIGISLR